MGDTYYKARYKEDGNITEIIIIYRGSRVFSMEFYGQLQAPAIRQYAIEAVEVLIDKGVIKRETD